MTEEWYSNKELYEQMQELKKELSDISKELLETRTLIRDYNGLREDITTMHGAIRGIAWFVSIAVGVLTLLEVFLQ